MADGFANDFDTFNLCRYVGQTVTIFTTSGGASGFGFTGVLMSANDCFVRLLTKVGAAPECPIGSACGGPPVRGAYDYGCNIGFGAYGCGLGSVVVIPTDRISSFVHNAI